MKLYHASQDPNLEIKGLDPNYEPTVSMEKQGYIYLGSLDYIKNQYLSYAPAGLYNIYQIDVNGLYLDKNLPGEQVRTTEYISPKRVTFKFKIHSTPDKHPRENDYLKWMKELGKM